jgi:hypothetical protein
MPHHPASSEPDDSCQASVADDVSASTLGAAPERGTSHSCPLQVAKTTPACHHLTGEQSPPVGDTSPRTKVPSLAMTKHLAPSQHDGARVPRTGDARCLQSEERLATRHT